MTFITPICFKHLLVPKKTLGKLGRGDASRIQKQNNLLKLDNSEYIVSKDSNQLEP